MSFWVIHLESNRSKIMEIQEKINHFGQFL